ncbi:MAG TPA: L-ribulose-5-phosphate 4-epimerase AraD [Polyangia bacterium]|nr:L-ribulose-5-phosphate 4-epimerase AraD [Polyangia bacterium]
MAERLRREVLHANRVLADSGLVMGTFGNVSGVDRDAGLLVIKPSGVAYEGLTAADLVPVALADGRVLEGTLRPSSDTPTHLEIYRAFDCGGVVHTHSAHATAFAQARLPIRCMGTTHADHFRGDIPVTRPLTGEEIAGEYERQTGLVIVETFRAGGLRPEEISAVLVAHHGPFTWGRDALAAVEQAQALEYVARLEATVRAIAPDAARPDAALVDRHFLRKHGPGSYYGQK